MATICDTNILIDIYGAEQAWHEWSRDRTAAMRREGTLVINPIIYAEFSVGYASVGQVDEILIPSLFQRENLPWPAAFDAGSAFKAYRRQRGDKRSPLPDFYIGAHALVGGHHLLTRDPARYRTYFPDLQIISPGDASVIGKLKGTVDEVEEDSVTLDVHGVGYVAYCGARTLAGLPGPGEAAALFIETYVREDMIRLYGFASAAERDWFRLLQSVQGVGAKVALAVVGILSPGDLASAIALQDKATVARAPGVGPKVAARIVAELKDKAPAFSGAASMESFGLKREIGEGVAPAPISDAVSALVNLGYSREQAASAVATAVREAGEGAASTVLIRLGLKAMSR